LTRIQVILNLNILGWKNRLWWQSNGRFFSNALFG
jgi:hypothetical protein